VIPAHDPKEELAEMLQLSIKAGRRCVHDFDHAVDEIRDPATQEFFRERIETWRSIFYPDNGVKNYRHELHQTIYSLETQVERLKALCRANGIDPQDPEGIPF
jgi:hypothetical protein